jgi:hypothetical protein
MYSYFTYYWYGETEKPVENSTIAEEDKEPIFVPANVTLNDITKIKLKPVEHRVLSDIIPNPSRNAPPNFSRVDMRNLNRAQLNSILNVKLKPIPVKEKPVYIPRHPVLRELLTRF